MRMQIWQQGQTRNQAEVLEQEQGQAKEKLIQLDIYLSPKQDAEA
jgi:hypothetical protein